jgi:hypothetical protein
LIARAALRAALSLTGAALGALIITVLLLPLASMTSGTTPSPQHPAEAMLDEDCWTGPDERTAVSAVVTLKDERTVRGPRHLDSALEHVFEDKHPRLRVHGFCATP